MSRRFRRRPPGWFWLVLGAAAVLAARGLWNEKTQQVIRLPNEAIVASVIDGQTVALIRHAGDRPVAVRLLGVGINDDTGARKWLEANVHKRSVRIERDKRRRAADGAQLAYLYCGDELVNAELIRHGYARFSPYPGDSQSYARQLRAAALK